MHTAEATTITYRAERARAVASGILETAQQTFFLLIAVRVFAAGPTAKALIASSNSLGLILSLVAVTVVASRGWLPATAAARVTLVGAASTLLMCLLPALPVFIAGSVITLTSLTIVVPFLTQIYQDNYPAAERGRRFSQTVMIRIAVSAGFSALAGWALSRQLGWYRGLLVVYAVACVWGALCLARCPSRPLPAAGGRNPLRALRYCRDDALFRWSLIAWMVMGFANLMMVPLRVEYLANPRYGLNLSAGTIALLTGVLPNIARLALSPLWGRWFDRLNFLALRAILNLGFALGILTFFTTQTMTGLIAGALIFGVSTAGGEVTWNLWVTKFAPAHRVADYMGVHTFFTGLRGLVAPLVAFHLLDRLSIAALGGFSAALIAVSSLILFREYKLRRAPDPGTTVVEKSAVP